MIKNWKKLKEEVIKVGFRSVIKRTFELPDGRVDEYTINHWGESVCILPITENNEVVLFKQFRPGPEKVLLELPGGHAEKQKPIHAAERELLEETGYAGDIKFVGTNYHCGYSDRIRYNFVATNCKKIQEQQLDKNEFGEVVLMPLKEFREHLRSGELTDVETGYLGLDFLNLL